METVRSLGALKPLTWPSRRDGRHRARLTTPIGFAYEGELSCSEVRADFSGGTGLSSATPRGDSGHVARRWRPGSSASPRVQAFGLESSGPWSESVPEVTFSTSWPRSAVATPRIAPSEEAANTAGGVLEHDNDKHKALNRYGQLNHLAC